MPAPKAKRKNGLKKRPDKREPITTLINRTKKPSKGESMYKAKSTPMLPTPIRSHGMGKGIRFSTVYRATESPARSARFCCLGVRPPVFLVLYLKSPGDVCEEGEEDEGLVGDRIKLVLALDAYNDPVG